MNVVFRVDSSSKIGAGHVMRCLVLASELRALGAECHFVTQQLPGGIENRISNKGFKMTLLPRRVNDDTQENIYAWSPEMVEQDAVATRAVCESEETDWLIVDHYAIDSRWEQATLRPETTLMVIDDLANRAHCAHLLLDQNLGKAATAYDRLVPEYCVRLIGPMYALLRPEFERRRTAVLSERKLRNDRLGSHILISMGGSDPNNMTSIILCGLVSCELPKETQITVVMGGAAPTLDSVRSLARTLPWQVRVLSDVDHMVELIANADFGVGAAGSSVWERCVLGLPSIVFGVAPNQLGVVQALTSEQAILYIDATDANEVGEQLPAAIRTLADPEYRRMMSMSAATICDGGGVHRVVDVVNRLTRVEKSG